MATIPMADDGVNTKVEAVSEASTETIELKTADGGVFDVDKSVAMEFLILKSFYEDEGRVFDKTSFSLPNVKERELSKVIEYCTRALEFGAKSAAAAGDRDAERVVRVEREGFEAEFVNELSNDILKELILAVDYLDIKEMLDFLTQSVANRIQNRSVEYVRQFFDIANDFTPQEEEQIHQENAWAFEGVDAD
ncbi:SKP1-like protein 20 [Carya illinoinensis]|uniref:SKP1-like protein n=1 Tax=Carya illinoinensis TaxID=32201 RepID=A0A8T1P2E8_CARIL|nr:SKP1-like protein 20 [Carya illinoinensis]KAG6635702.1 hypothetical protein CIPAW_11G061200 [Carya illinoinensis]